MHLRVLASSALVLSGLFACASRSGEDVGTLSQRDSTAWTADNCLRDQDMDAADVDISRCPALPEYPENAPLGAAMVSLGAWEIGTTADGETYKYGGLTFPDGGAAVLSYDGGEAAVNAENIACWAKGYYRLRTILQNPPREYVALRSAGFQGRFFQFQTDLRNGGTGYRRISSYLDHLVKWVTVISASGECQQPTFTQFRNYATSELVRRGLPLPADEDAGAATDGAATDGGAATDAATDPDAAP